MNYKRNKLKKLDEAWKRGDYVSHKLWSDLKWEIETLAKESDEAGHQKGVPHTDSAGNRQLEPAAEQVNLVAIALDLYRQKKQ